MTWRRVMLVVALLSAGVFLGVPPALGATPPSAPAWLAAGGDVDGVSLLWAVSSRAEWYNVFRANSEAGAKTFLGSPDPPTTNLFYDDTAIPGQEHYYWVTACNTAGCSTYSPYDTATRKGPPPAPTGVQASWGTHTGFIRVSWQASPGAHHYFVYRGEAPSGPWTWFGATTNLTVDNSPPHDGIQYWYTVKACTASGDDVCSDYASPNGGWSNGDPPPAPDNVQATDGTELGGVRVTYSLEPSAIYYNIAVNNIGSKPAPMDTDYDGDYFATGLQEGKRLYFWVDSCNYAGCSDRTLYEQGWVGREPQPPTNVQASDGDYADRVRITFDPWLDPNTTFNVYRNVSGNGTFATRVGTGLMTIQWDDMSATPGQSFYYWVTTVNAQGESGLSAPDTGYAEEGVTPSPSATPSRTPSAQPTASGSESLFLPMIWRVTP